MRIIAGRICPNVLCVKCVCICTWGKWITSYTMVLRKLFILHLDSFYNQYGAALFLDFFFLNQPYLFTQPYVYWLNMSFCFKIPLSVEQKNLICIWLICIGLPRGHLIDLYLSILLRHVSEVLFVMSCDGINLYRLIHLLFWFVHCLNENILITKIYANKYNQSLEVFLK